MSDADDPNDPENLIAAAIDAAEDIRDPLEGLVEKTADRSRRALCARRSGAPRGAEEGRPRRVRGAARAVEEGRLPGDGARRRHRRGERRYRRARTDAGRHPDRPRAVRPSCSTRRTAPASPISTSTATARPGRSAQGLPPLAGTALLRGNAGRAEFRGAAIGAERDRGQGAFRRARACRSTSASAGSTGGSISTSATTAWRAVEIDATGWRVIDKPPVRFRRAAGMQPLPMPVPGGSIETLRSFLNVQSDATSCWWSPGRWPSCAIAAPIR